VFSPELETRRLALANMKPEHQGFVHRHFSNTDVSRYLVDAAPVRTLADAGEIIAFYEDPESTLRNRWVLIDKSDRQPVGTIGFHRFDEPNRRIEVGYDLSPTRWGSGLMSEAMTAVLDHAFTGLDLYRVEAYVHVGNHRSTALLERHRFEREGTIRAQYLFDGVWHDHHLYGLLEPDRT